MVYYQRALAERVKQGCPDHLLLLEHEPVFTFGVDMQGEELADMQLAVVKQGGDVACINRIGKATFHGPGQVTGYHISRGFAGNSREYIVKMRNTLIEFLQSQYGIPVRKRQGSSGVWHSDKKIASVGPEFVATAPELVTMHGFALDVNTNLQNYKLISPCGYPSDAVISMAEVLGKSLEINGVMERLAAFFVSHHGLQLEERVQKMSVAG